jgi:alpha-amylase/alpha-mannosidase (GH57 family)
MKRLSYIAVALTFALAACSFMEPAITPTLPPITPQFFATDTPTPVPDPIYLSIIWDYHQPAYPLDTPTGLVTRPWVRTRATGVYHDMAATLQKYPRVHVAFNFSPVLARQINDLATGGRDLYWEMATRPASSLSDADKRFILSRFFDADSASVVERFPRYKELLDQRGSALSDAALQSFSEQDVRDLQVWFNLAACGSDLLAQSPLKELAAKGRDFSEEDKRTLFDVLLATVRSIVPQYAGLQESGQIEISTSPYAHPILPLLIDTSIASDPQTSAPEPPFRFEQDAVEQIRRATDLYQQLYGQAPRGLLPSGGAVAPNIIKPVSAGGYEWMVSGEMVLARSLNAEGFARDEHGVTRQADVLYRPYTVAGPEGSRISMLFGDTLLAGQVISGFSAADPGAAAQDLVNQIVAIKAGLAQQKSASPHLVTLVVDAELASGGNSAFLDSLYQRLTEAADRYEIQTITPSEFLATFPESRALESLRPGAGMDIAGQDTGYRAWVGTPELNTAWNYLQNARKFLDAYLSGTKTAEREGLNRAYEAMLLSEGSDWLQWYGSGRDLNEQHYYDQSFRQWLAQVYSSVGAPVPDYVSASIYAANVITSTQTMNNLISPTIDGMVNGAEWDGAGAVSMADPNGIIDALYYGVNADNLYFRVDARDDWGALATGVDTAQPLRVSVYFAKPGAGDGATFTRVGGDGEVRSALGMNATHLLEWSLDPDGTSSTALYAANPDGSWSGTATVYAPGAAVGKVLEMAVPLQSLGGLAGGGHINMVVTVNRDVQRIATFPPNGLAQLSLPEASKPAVDTVAPLLSADDPAGDDHGPGNYTYPTNGVFEKGVYDLKHFEIISDAGNLTFKLVLNGPIKNVWNSTIGLSVQTFDIYIDKDPGKGTGERKLLEGRNASLPKGDGWDYALWVEGWAQEILAPDGKGGIAIEAENAIKVEIDPAGVALIEVPRAALGEGDPAAWGYALAVLSQEAFPSEGVRRVRDVTPEASQWRLGGAPDDTNHTRIIDVLVPAQGRVSQEAGLSAYSASTEAGVSALPADAFGSVPMITISK